VSEKSRLAGRKKERGTYLDTLLGRHVKYRDTDFREELCFFLLFFIFYDE